jgi:plasmid stabilization system protein ParE
MRGYTISRTAQRDLRSIRDYVARYSASGANRILDGFFQRFRFLGANPLAGERRTDLAGDEYRVFSAGSYVIYYRLRRGRVSISRVFHGARDLD